MPRRVRHKVTPERIRSLIHMLSNRLRANRDLLYDFDFTTRAVLMQIQIDPEGSYRKLMRWIRTSDQIPTWQRVEELAAEYQIDLHMFAKQQKWEYSELETAYNLMREVKDELKEGLVAGNG